MLIEKAEFQDLASLAAHRQRCWEHQREYVVANSQFYCKLWGGTPPPETLDALPDLPCSGKEELRISQRDHPPFGNYLAARPEAIARIHRTSGTTGTAMNLALSLRDAHETATVGARAQGASGLGPGHRVVHCLNYRLWMGGFTDHTTLEATGATVVPFGVGDSRGLVQTILQLCITAISCTPSYPAVLEQVIADEFPELRPRDLGLQLGLFGGEAGLDDPAFRNRLEEVWGLQPRNANYGVSDVFCNFAGQTELETDLHFMGLDVLHPELIEPESQRILPWQEGETGELILTHMDRECQPLVRFRTGDIITLTGTGRARCGRTAPRFRVIGRADDMVLVRGINIFPTQVASLLNRIDELSGEYRIVLEGNGPYDSLPLEVECSTGLSGEGEAGLTEELMRQVKRELGATARITLLPPGSLPRSAGKTRRVIRKDRPRCR